MNRNVAVVILNWNGRTLLEQFLPSVVRYSELATIYIADNASSDDSLEFVKNTYPEIRIIKNEINGGYAKGYNDALKLLDEEILCLLNSDVEVTENWLDPIITTFNKEPKAAIIQPKILDFLNREKFEYAGAAGGYVDKYGYPYCRGRIFNTIESDKLQYKDSEIFWASGACFFIRNEVFQTLGGFDESFFAHMEEIDLCWRAFNGGHIAKYVSDSTVLHVGGATLKTNDPKKTYLNFRNSLFTLIKNASGNIFGLILMRLILDGIAAIRFMLLLKLNHVFAILKAHFSFYFNLNRLLKHRKTLNQNPNYYTVSSIVWRYFILGKTEYSRL